MQICNLMNMENLLLLPLRLGGEDLGLRVSLFCSRHFINAKLNLNRPLKVTLEILRGIHGGQWRNGRTIF